MSRIPVRFYWPKLGNVAEPFPEFPKVQCSEFTIADGDPALVVADAVDRINHARTLPNVEEVVVVLRKGQILAEAVEYNRLRLNECYYHLTMGLIIKTDKEIRYFDMTTGTFPVVATIDVIHEPRQVVNLVGPGVHQCNN